MKKVITLTLMSVLALGAGLLFTACSRAFYVENATGDKVPVTEIVAGDGSTKYVSVNPETGTETEVPADTVQSQLELSPAVEETVESALDVGNQQGGWVGAISSLLLLGWGVYKSRKANATQLTLSSVVTGVADVLQAARIAVAEGQKLTEEDITALLKAAQNDAGTRDAVRKLLAEQKTVAEGWLSKLWSKIKNAIF